MNELLDSPPSAYTLTALDRCDRCGAQAYVSVTLENGSLLFCGHHWNTFKGKLIESAVAIQDETARLLIRPDGSDH